MCFGCETVAFAEVSEENEVNEIQPYRFKMAVTPEKVFFSGKDFPVFAFDDVKMGDDGGFAGAQNLFGETITIGEFSPPNLKVLMMRKSLLSFRAYCETF